MQTIYIDVLIFLNMLEDFLLLLGVKRVLRIKVKSYRLLLGSLWGGALSLAVFLPDMGFWFCCGIKLLSSITLTIITFGCKNLKLFIKEVLTLFVISFLFSGAMIFFCLAFKPKGMKIINDVVYFDISPALLIILTLIIYFILLIYKSLFKNRENGSRMYKVKILYKNNISEFSCKCDSGLSVKEPFSGSSVIIAEKSILNNIEPCRERMRIIPFESLGGKGIIYGFKAEEVYIDGKKSEEEIYIGICDNLLKEEAKGLVPENLVKG